MKSLTKSIFSRNMLSVLLLGISSGLPILLIGSTLKAWLKKEEVDLTLIGFFSLTGLPYTLKFVWSPFLDRYYPGFFDRRRGWIVIFQILLTIGFLYVAQLDVKNNLGALGVLCVLIALFAASQDVVIDAYRREILEENELGLGASMGVNGYRIGMLLSGAVALGLADQMGWENTYLCMAAIMAAFILVTWFAPKITDAIPAPKTLQSAVLDPLKQYFSRKGALEILLFVLLFKIGDSMASDMFSPFYIDIGFSLTEIAVASKLCAFWSTIAGGIIGGIWIMKMGILRSLWIFGILQAISTFGFSVLAGLGHSIPALVAVVIIENVASGMGSAAYVAFMSKLCDRRFTATQFALLSSLAGVPRVIIGSSSGYIAKNLGWSNYFLFCTLIALPGMLLLLRSSKWQTEESA